MSDELADQFESPIISLKEGEPYVGIPGIQDSSLPLILIPNEPGVQPPIFKFTRIGNPENRTYEIRIGDRTTLIEESSVVAARDRPAQEWGIYFRESENGFTIQRGVFRPATVWTAEGNRIGIQINPGTNFPKEQLFRFKGVTDV